MLRRSAKHWFAARPPLLPDRPDFTDWRLELGAEALRSTSRSVQRVALDSGYESEAAFNRAFKRRFSVPPARYRREARAAVAAKIPPAQPLTVALSA